MGFDSLGCTALGLYSFPGYSFRALDFWSLGLRGFRVEGGGLGLGV